MRERIPKMFVYSHSHSRHRAVALGAATLACAASSALAQPLNLDHTTLAGAPAPTYAAAANQPGLWNALPGGTALPLALFDTSGAATAATFEISPARSAYAFNNPLTSGDAEALMDDGLDLGALLAPSTATIHNLVPGFYGVYVYSWAPESSLFSTGVSIGTSIAMNAEHPVGGAWPGDHALGITFAYSAVLIANPGDDLVIDFRTLAGFGTLNGMQVAPIPAPAGAGLALVAVGAIGRRRRQTLGHPHI